MEQRRKSQRCFGRIRKGYTWKLQERDGGVVVRSKVIHLLGKVLLRLYDRQKVGICACIEIICDGARDVKKMGWLLILLSENLVC